MCISQNQQTHSQNTNTLFINFRRLKLLSALALLIGIVKYLNVIKNGNGRFAPMISSAIITVCLGLICSCPETTLEVSYLGEEEKELLLSGPKSSFQMKVNSCISFGNQGPRVRRKSVGTEISCLKSSVKFPQSGMIW